MRNPFALASLAAVVALSSCQCDAVLGQLHPLISLDVGRVEFPDTVVGTTARQVLRLSNPGTAPLRITTLAIVGDGGPFTLDAHGLDALEAGNEADVDVAFSPRIAGVALFNVSIVSNAENRPQITVQLTGVGVDAPDCDDGNPCTDERFDLEAGECVAGFNSSPCDDGSACTDNDRCDAGSCVGDAVVCEDAVECTRDLCDPATGCAFVADDDACDDGNACLSDVCNPSRGCEHPPAPDGTRCGRLIDCDVIDLCVATVCSAFEIPDGSPCNDGDICTSSDTCDAGSCAGQQAQLPPTVLGESHRLLLPRDAIVVGNNLLVGDQRLRVIPLDDVRFAPVDSDDHIVAQTPLDNPDGVDLGPDVALFKDGAGHVAALTHVPAETAETAAQYLLFFDENIDDRLDFVDELAVNPRSPALSNSRFGALSTTALTVCRAENPGDAFVVDRYGVDAPHVRTSFPRTSTLLCGVGDHHSSDGRHALDVVGGNIAVIDLGGAADADLAEVGLVAVPDGAPAGSSWRVRGERGYISGRDGGAVTLVDLSDPSAPRAALFVPAQALFFDELVDITPDAPGGLRVIAHDRDGYRQVDIDDINAPEIVGWFVDTPDLGAIVERDVIAAEGAVAVVSFSSTDWRRVKLDEVGTVGTVALDGFGGIGRIVGDNGRLLGVSATQLTLIDANATLSALRLDTATARFTHSRLERIQRTGSANPTFAVAPINDSTLAQGGLEAGRITDDSAEVTPVSSFHDLSNSTLFTIDDNGTVTSVFDGSFQIGSSPPVQAVTSVGRCGAAALVVGSLDLEDGDCDPEVPNDPDCLDPDPSCDLADTACRPIEPCADCAFAGVRVFTFSTCADDTTTVTSQRIMAFTADSAADLRDDVARARGVAHGDSVTFFVGGVAVLVDVSDVFDPVVAGVAVDAAFDGAASVSAGFDGRSWVLTSARPGTAPVADFFDVDLGGARPFAEVELAPAASIAGAVPRIVRTRVLAVEHPRAWISVWDGTEGFERGHHVVAYDLTTSPPSAAEDFTLTSEPVGMVVDEGKLVVGRVDGVSVISPPCR